MRLSKKISWLLAAMLVLSMLVLFVQRAEADDDYNSGGDVTQSNDMNNQTAGDIVTGGVSSSNKTFAFSHSLGDVDINEGKNCLGSEAWGSFIISRQTNELNPWCASLFYELNGKHEFAAKMRCDIKDIRKKYTTDSECWSDQDLSPAAPAPTVIDGFNDEQRVQNDELEQVQALQESVLLELDRLTAQIESAPSRQPRPVIVQQSPPEQYTDEQVNAVWAALKGGDEDE